MIARTWHGRCPRLGLTSTRPIWNGPACRTTGRHPVTAGCGCCDGRRGATHFLLLSLWESMDSIRAFAGDEVERARYYPEDEGFLLELEPHVTHYDVLVRPSGAEATR